MSLRGTVQRALATNVLIAICLSFVVCCSFTSVKGQSQEDVDVFLTVIDPRVVSDVFGKRIAKRFIAIQVTVTNSNADYQYLVQDVSLDFKDVYTGPAIPAAVLDHKVPPYNLSSLSLSLLRGVAEKGQGQDKRNKFLRLFRAVGTIAGGLVGVVGAGPSFAESVAVFNGPVINSYSEAFPDYTINQMNRLNDTAYEPNSLIPKQQAKVIVAFVPQSLFLTKKQQEIFWREPMELFRELDLRRTDAFVQGNFIANVNNLPPFVTDIQIDPEEMKHFQNNQPVVKGYISGRFLSGTTVRLLSTTPAGLSLTPDGPPTDTRVNFTINSTQPVRPDTPLSFRIANSQGVQIQGTHVAYMPEVATLAGPPAPATGSQGSSVRITLTGTGFIPEVTRVIPLSGTGVTVTSVEVKGGTQLEATLVIDAGASVGAHQLAVNNGGGVSNKVVFTVN